MDEPLLHAIQRMIGRLTALAREDEELRADLHKLGETLIKAAAPCDRTDEEATETPPVDVASIPTPETPAERVVQTPLPELTLGRITPPAPRAEPPTTFRNSRDVEDEDLEAIEARCRLKAEGLRWAWDRRSSDLGSAETAAKDRDIIERAKGLECQLWMNSPHFRVPADPGRLDEAAGCFEAVAAAVALLRGLLQEAGTDHRLFKSGLELLAEAQSGLRIAIDRLDGRKDPDQFAVYTWLRGVAYREQIYLPRFMTLDRPADPADHQVVLERIRRLHSDRGDIHRQTRERKSLFGKLRYHARRAREGLADEHDWQKINVTLDNLIAAGEPPSSVEIREEVLPIVDQLPDVGEPSRGLVLVLREIDSYLAARRTTSESDQQAEEPPTPDVAEAAQLLEGKTVVLIGGACRPGSERALCEAFRLKELIWVETREHESIERFKPFIGRSDVALVILAIRWSSHSFAEIKPYCDLHGKPLLRLPRGYNPNQVARELLDQCSERLRDTSDDSNA
ncbi:hypothetical protein [Paludisphaera rhizosphaerae]|uniref:hypothetical protein n=1 Tax=Paludisphaera rhizosphaerae TaxID=2711216 RepID=UPI0013EC2B6B|nr:hypothetical protein [Paludisphaera rhizosphaerae]